MITSSDLIDIRWVKVTTVGLAVLVSLPMALFGAVALLLQCLQLKMARYALIAAAPSLAFWTTSLALHLCGANEFYTGRVKVSDMLRSQIIVDILQFLCSASRFFFETEETASTCRFSKLAIGMIIIDFVEYWCHRTLHSSCFPTLRKFHKRHHALKPLHTFGAYYNSTPEALFTGSILGLFLVVIGGLSALEVAVVSSAGTIATVFDHCPSKPGLPPSHHEIHHNINSEVNFAQPFSPAMDWIFGTLYDDEKARTPTRENKNDHID